MLSDKEKLKIEKYIDKVLKDIEESARKEIEKSAKKIDFGKNAQQVRDILVDVSAKKLASESKAILSTTYNMLKDQTLKKSLYEDPSKKAAFYEADILTQLSSNVNFDVPKQVDYQKSKTLVKELCAAGIIEVIGGGVLIITHNIRRLSKIPVKLPVGIIMAVVAIWAIKEIPTQIAKSKDKLSTAIGDYLNSVKMSLLQWVESIGEYFDEQIEQLEKGWS